MATNLDRPANLETWIGHPHGLRLRRHPDLAKAEPYLAEFPMVIRFAEIIEKSRLPVASTPTISVETLPAFRQSTVGLTVELRIEVDFPSAALEMRLTRFSLVSDEIELQEFVVLRPGKRQSVCFPFPEFHKPLLLRVDMDIRDEGRVTHACVLQPEKKWTWYVAFQTHLDLGWTDRADKVVASLKKMTSEDAVRICRQFSGNAPGQRFVWTCECSEALRFAWEGSDSGQREDLLWCIKNGLIESCVLPYTFHTHLMSRNLLRRAIHRSFDLREEIGAKGMLDLSVAQQNDVPGHNWVLPDLLAEAGVKRAIVGHNWLVRGCPLPPLFRWRGPDGGEVLTLSTSCMNYGGNAGVPARPDDLRGLSQNSPEGLDVQGDAIFKTITYGENCGPEFADVEIGNIQKWQAEFVWPRIHVGGPKDYFAHIEPSLDRSSLPVVDRDISDWWIDGPASMPTAMGKFRRAMKALPTMKDSPKACTLEDSLILFSEHTFGLNAQLVKVNAAKAGWKIDDGFENYIASWEDKEAYAERAWQLASAAPASQESSQLAGLERDWEISSDAHGISRLVDPFGRCWVDSALTPDWPRLGTLIQRFVPRETGSWLHHDLPFAPNQGTFTASVVNVSAVDLGDEYGVEVLQRLTSPAGSIPEIRFRLTAKPGGSALRARLSIVGKEATAQSEALGLSFPWCVTNPEYSGDVGGRLLRVDRDQVPASNRDAQAFGDGWIVADGENRMAVSSPDAFLWHFGGFRYCEFNKNTAARSGETYAHLCNNAWQTNFRVWVGGDLDFQFFLRPLEADDEPMDILSKLSRTWLLP